LVNVAKEVIKMGLIDFVLSAGEKLFGGGGPSPEEKAQALRNAIMKHGLEVENLKVEVKEDVAVISGTTPSQEMREKIILAAGNNEGIARVDDRLEVVKPEPEAQYYTVKKGDSLSKISKQYYGDAMKYPVIFEANKPMLKDPDLIYPGQVLRIPPQ
jgi:nucleoid-associated protein YgaU